MPDDLPDEASQKNDLERRRRDILAGIAKAAVVPAVIAAYDGSTNRANASF